MQGLGRIGPHTMTDKRIPCFLPAVSQAPVATTNPALPLNLSDTVVYPLQVQVPVKREGSHKTFRGPLTSAAGSRAGQFLSGAFPSLGHSPVTFTYLTLRSAQQGII